MPNAIDQYNTLLNLIETTFGENTERTSRLSRMYTNMRDRILVAPASSREYFHNCYPGGYLDHVLRVYEAATLLVPVYKTMGGAIDFTQAELTFATLHHDLGKLGMKMVLFTLNRTQIGIADAASYIRKTPSYN
jgi:hypothetical protein